jgi:hypothetical protein
MSLAKTEYYKSDLLSVRYVACRSAEKGLSDVESVDADTLILPLLRERKGLPRSNPR